VLRQWQHTNKAAQSLPSDSLVASVNVPDTRCPEVGQIETTMNVTCYQVPGTAKTVDDDTVHQTVRTDGVEYFDGVGFVAYNVDATVKIRHTPDRTIVCAENLQQLCTASHRVTKR